MKRRIATAILALVAGTTIVSGRQAPATPVFKSGGVTVSLHTTVRAGTGRLVPDLTAEDFTVLDNDRPQPLSVFERKALPISVLLLLDSSESMRGSIMLLRDAAKQFVAQLLPADRAQIGAFNKDIRLVRPFTSDRTRLNEVLNYFGPKSVDFGTALWPAIDEGIKELGAVDGRKVLLVFSDGEGNVGQYSPLSAFRAIAADIMVYAITLKTEYRASNGRSAKSVLDPELPKLAEETGGGYFELSKADDLGTTFARVAEELHHQYTLGFEAPELDGKTHQLSVRVRGENMTVRSRRSYVAALPK
jgi:Ca-activated chloride channel family protein